MLKGKVKNKGVASLKQTDFQGIVSRTIRVHKLQWYFRASLSLALEWEHLKKLVKVKNNILKVA